MRSSAPTKSASIVALPWRRHHVSVVRTELSRDATEATKDWVAESYPEHERSEGEFTEDAERKLIQLAQMNLDTPYRFVRNDGEWL